MPQTGISRPPQFVTPYRVRISKAKLTHHTKSCVPRTEGSLPRVPGARISPHWRSPPCSSAPCCPWLSHPGTLQTQLLTAHREEPSVCKRDTRIPAGEICLLHPARRESLSWQTAHLPSQLPGTHTKHAILATIYKVPSAPGDFCWNPKFLDLLQLFCTRKKQEYCCDIRAGGIHREANRLSHISRDTSDGKDDFYQPCPEEPRNRLTHHRTKCLNKRKLSTCREDKAQVPQQLMQADPCTEGSKLPMKSLLSHWHQKTGWNNSRMKC